MSLEEFIKQIIEQGIEAAKRGYKRKDEKALLKGSIAGFEACLGKNPLQLQELLDQARKNVFGLFARKANPIKKETDKYWEARGFELEVEWVCNCVSAILYNQKLPVIITPTARGMIVASKIVGVKKYET